MSNNDQPKKTKKSASYDGRGAFDVDISPMDYGNDTSRRAGPGISFEPMISPISPDMSSFGLRGAMYNPTQATTSQKQPIVAPSKSSTVDPFVWKLREVPTLPEFHPLERTAVFIEDSSPSQISERISKVLRERSIEAEYEDDKAKAKCLSSEGVDFRVRMYRGRGKYSRGIIVEVQRRFGSSNNFHKHVAAILDAAEGMSPPPPPPALRSADALPLVSDAEDDYAPTSGTSSLLMVEKMFGHGGYDSQYLALQTLSSLTDVKKMGIATAKAVSTDLLSSSNEIGNKLIDLSCNKEEEEGLKLRSLAFCILANSLEATNGCLDNLTRELLRPVLLKELKSAESSPRTAQMAARCFEFLYKGDHDQGEIAAALEKAQSVGAARHAGLYQQAQRCLDKML